MHCYVLTVKIKGKVNPPQQFATIGKNVQFSCDSEGSASWYLNGGKLPQNVIKHDIHMNNLLEIRTAQLDNAGTYTCHGQLNDLMYSSEATKNFYFEDEGVLTVVGK